MSDGGKQDQSHVLRDWAASVVAWIIISVIALYFTTEYRPNGMAVVLSGVLAGGYWLVVRPVMLLIIIICKIEHHHRLYVVVGAVAFAAVFLVWLYVRA